MAGKFANIQTALARIAGSLTIHDLARTERCFDEAGKLLHELVTSERLVLDDGPEWMKSRPTGYVHGHPDGPCEADHWSTYWWCAVVWLSHNKPGGGIVLPDSPALRRTAGTAWLDFHYQFLAPAGAGRWSEESELRVYHDLIQASLDAFTFLDSIEPAAQSPAEIPEGEWSTPMSKAEMARRLGMSTRVLNTFAQRHAIRTVGSRQLWQIRLDGIDAASRRRLETEQSSP